MLNRYVISVLVPAFALTLSVAAQQVANDEGIGFPAHGIFSGSDFANVQVNNGNLHIEIPLWTVPGRGGLSFAMKYVYDSKGWKVNTRCPKNLTCDGNVQPGPHAQISLEGPFGYRLTGGRSLGTNGHCGSSGIQYEGYRLIEPDGTTHHFVPDPYCDGSTTKFYADDGSGWKVEGNGGTTVTAIRRKDGLVIAQNNSSLTDANGNQLTKDSTGVVTDTAGRTYALDGSYKDSGGVSRSLQITTTSVPIQTNICPYYTAGNPCTDLTATWTVPQVITLPNGMQYTFQYEQNQFGEPNLITLPTGGQITFTYGPPVGAAGRWVTSRTETANGVSATWSYAYTYASTNPSTLIPHIVTATVTDPANNDTKATFLCTPLLDNTFSGPCYESKVQTFQGAAVGGIALKTVDTSYITVQQGTVNNLLLPSVEKTTWNQQNLVSQIQTDWDSFQTFTDFGNPSNSAFTSWRNIKERREYSFGVGNPGALVRKTHYNYLHLDAPNASTYRAVNIADIPISKIVYDASGTNAVAQTTYTYDGVAIARNTSSTPAPNHDYTNFPSSYNTRGNLTQLGRGLKTGSTWSFLNTNNTYDDLGNTLTTKDPALHTTTFDYTDNWKDTNCTLGSNTFVYLTQTTDALNHHTKHSYFRCTGLVASTQDQNDINASRGGTNFTYDLVNRPVTISYADGGQTTKSYVDTVPLSVTQTKLVTTGLNIQSSAVFDGLGRIQQTQFNDPDCGGGTGLIKVNHAYGFTSGAGKFTQVSTPYCNSPDATHGLMATTNYDAVDRVTSVAQADGSTITTTYGGTAAGLTSTVTDEASNARTSQSDALGRMTVVWEDPSGLNYETDYGYDTLDNLTSVTQKGGAASSSWRTRTFTHDSLSRLKCAANPEVTSSVNTPASCPASDTGTYTPGTIGYTYDADGNVQTKTAPAPNQTAASSTVATTYSYDALNRLTQKSYAGGPSTATVKYGYDGLALSGCATAPPALSPVDANPISYRSAMCDGSGATAWSHDPMGRTLTEQRIINGTSAINRNTKYTYYKDGELNKLTYPGAGRVITYTANSSGGFSAGRPVSAIAGDGTSYVSGATYAPQGAPSALTFGGTVNGAFTYNKRLQPAQMFYGTNAPGGLTGVSCPATIGNIMHRAYDFHVGAGDNGNVFIVRNCLNTSRTQTFTYDSLNRIATAATQGTTCTACWGQRFGHMSGTTFVPGIDAWGNLHEITATQGSPTTLTQAASNNNQFVGMTYDAAGNLTNDGQGSTYTYDAENRLTATTATAGYSYVYDGDGKRVKKCSNSGCTTGKLYWTGMGSDPLAESGVGGSNTEEYVFFNGNRVARRDVSNLAVHYYFSDHLGSASVITDNLGTVQKEADYYPFGGESVVSGSDINNYKFTGKERDAESGLDYFGARYYGSSMGRWMSPDNPLADQHRANPQSWNLYSYTRNNPVAFIDPDGRAVEAMTALALQRIQSTVPKDVRSQITADKNGILNRKAIDAIKSSDANVKLLRQAVNAPKTIEVTTAPALQGGQPKELVNQPFSYQSVADQQAVVKAAGGDPSAITIPSLYLGVTQSADQSVSGNVRVTLSDGTGAAAGAPESEQSVTAAHELYGHALPDVNGQPSEHDNGGPVDKNIQQIEDHTRKLNEEPK